MTKGLLYAVILHLAIIVLALFKMPEREYKIPQSSIAVDIVSELPVKEVKKKPVVEQKEHEPEVKEEKPPVPIIKAKPQVKPKPVIKSEPAPKPKSIIPDRRRHERRLPPKPKPVKSEAVIKKEQEELERKQMEAEQRQIELAEQRRIEEEKRKELEQQQRIEEEKRQQELEEQQKIQEEKRRKAEEERQRQLEIERQKEAERKRLEEEKRKKEEEFKSVLSDLESLTASASDSSGIPLSFSEVAEIKRQIQKCWQIPPSAAQDRKVDLRVRLNRDGSLVSAAIIDNVGSDAKYRLLAESALRAVEKCSPLQNLPPEKFTSWQDMELSFDPQDLY